MALFARTKGLGVFVLEGRSLGTAPRELLVLVVGNEGQIVGFGRRVSQEAEAAADWFLFCRPGGDLVKENGDRSRENCVFESDGSTLPDGSEFKFGAAYPTVNLIRSGAIRPALRLANI